MPTLRKPRRAGQPHWQSLKPEGGLADGTIHEYEIDAETIHTQNPGSIWVAYIAANAAGLDKVNEAVLSAVKASPLAVPAMNSMVDFTPHCDSLARTNATYK